MLVVFTDIVIDGRVSVAHFNYTNNTSYPQTSISYTYDAADRATKLVDTGGGSPSSSGNTQVIGYDLLDNLTSEQAPEGTVSYTYPKWIIPGSMTAPGQPKANYSFDANNRLTNVTQSSPGTLAAGVPTYDGADRPTCVQLPNNVFATYGYDADSRVISITYGYSTSASCSSPPSNLGNLTYTYDADSRIIGVGGSLAAINLTPPTTSNATYTNRNQVNTWNGVAATSGSRDDLRTDPTNGASYTFDERNQLSTVNTTAYWFFYDAFGRRESFDDLGVVETYIYDSLQAVQTTNPSQNFFTTPDGEVLAFSSSSGTFVPMIDVLGSTIALTDSGKLYTQYQYEPFGVPTTIGNGSSYPFLFAGMEYDPTGLYHTWARYYSPRLQRFISEDPLQYGGGQTNLFAYAGNDPINKADPLGLQAVTAGTSAGYCAYGFAGDFGALLSLGVSVGDVGGASFGADAASALAAGSIEIAGGNTGAVSAQFGNAGGMAMSSLSAAGISDGAIIHTQADEEEDPVEGAVEQSRAWDEIFRGKTPVIPYGGLEVRTEKGSFLILPGSELGPVRNGRGYRFDWGKDTEVRVMGPRPEAPWNAPNGYIVFMSGNQAIDPATGRTLSRGEAHYKILP